MAKHRGLIDKTKLFNPFDLGPSVKTFHLGVKGAKNAFADGNERIIEFFVATFVVKDFPNLSIF